MRNQDLCGVDQVCEDLTCGDAIHDGPAGGPTSQPAAKCGGFRREPASCHVSQTVLTVEEVSSNDGRSAQVQPGDEYMVNVVDLDDPAALDYHLPLPQHPDGKETSSESSSWGEIEEIATAVDLDDPSAIDFHIPMSVNTDLGINKAQGHTADRCTHRNMREGKLQGCACDAQTPIRSESTVDDAAYNRSHRSGAEQPVSAAAPGERTFHSTRPAPVRTGDFIPAHQGFRNKSDGPEEKGTGQQARQQENKTCATQAIRHVLQVLKRQLRRLAQIIRGSFSRMGDRRKWTTIWCLAFCDSLGLYFSNTTLLLVSIIGLFNE